MGLLNLTYLEYQLNRGLATRLQPRPAYNTQFRNIACSVMPTEAVLVCFARLVFNFLSKRYIFLEYIELKLRVTEKCI